MSARILVVGAGAIGGVAAAHLRRAGHDVTVLDAAAEHVARINAEGLEVDDLGLSGDTRRVALPAVTSAADLTGRFDFAFITIKSTAIGAALTPLADTGLVETFVSLGNGLVHDRISDIVGQHRLLVGLVEWGATNVGPGRLRQTTRAPMIVGAPDGGPHDRVTEAAEIMAAITDDVVQAADITGWIWSKLLLNSTMSGLGVVGGMVYREIAADPLGRELAFRLWREGFETAAALGVELGEVVGVDPADLVFSGAPTRAAESGLDRIVERIGAVKASMWQDVERGLKTEVEVINGGVVAAAGRIGRSAPLNDAVVDIVHGYERGAGSPGWLSLACVVSAVER